MIKVYFYKNIFILLENKVKYFNRNIGREYALVMFKGKKYKWLINILRNLILLRMKEI